MYLNYGLDIHKLRFYYIQTLILLLSHHLWFTESCATFWCNQGQIDFFLLKLESIFQIASFDCKFVMALLRSTQTRNLRKKDHHHSLCSDKRITRLFKKGATSYQNHYEQLFVCPCVSSKEKIHRGAKMNDDALG